MTGDHQLLVGRNDKKGNAAIRARDHRPVRVRLQIELGPEPGEVLGDSRAHRRRVLADPGGEHEAVDPAERRSEPAGLEADAIREIIERKAGARVGALLERAHVVADARQGPESAFMVK